MSQWAQRAWVCPDSQYPVARITSLVLKITALGTEGASGHLSDLSLQGLRLCFGAQGSLPHISPGQGLPPQLSSLPRIFILEKLGFEWTLTFFFSGANLMAEGERPADRRCVFCCFLNSKGQTLCSLHWGLALCSESPVNPQ